MRSIQKHENVLWTKKLKFESNMHVIFQKKSQRDFSYVVSLLMQYPLRIQCARRTKYMQCEHLIKVWDQKEQQLSAFSALYWTTQWIRSYHDSRGQIAADEGEIPTLYRTVQIKSTSLFWPSVEIETRKLCISQITQNWIIRFGNKRMVFKSLLALRRQCWWRFGDICSFTWGSLPVWTGAKGSTWS
jgi:hypothetical protein